MPELTEHQAGFVTAYVSNGGNGSEAVLSISPNAQRPDAMAWALLKVPHVAAEIDRLMLRRFRGAAPQAFGVLQKLMLDEKMPAKVRQSCADSILDRAGHTAKRAEAEAAETRAKPISEMTAGELADLAAQQRATLLALEQKMLDVTPVSAQPPIQVIDNIEEA